MKPQTVTHADPYARITDRILEQLREGVTPWTKPWSSGHQLVETAEDLQQRGIGLKVLTQQIDTTTPGGCLVFHVFAAMAEFERELTLERTHAGSSTAKALGRRGGRKPGPGPAEVKRARAMLAEGSPEPSQCDRSTPLASTARPERMGEVMLGSPARWRWWSAPAARRSDGCRSAGGSKPPPPRLRPGRRI